MLFGSTPAPSLPLSRQQIVSCVAGPAYWREGGGGGDGTAWSRIILSQDSLGLYKSSILSGLQTVTSNPLYLSHDSSSSIWLSLKGSSKWDGFTVYIYW